MKYSFDHKAGVLPCLTFLSKRFYERPQRVGPAHTVTAVSNNLLSYSPRDPLSDRGHNSCLKIKLSAPKKTKKHLQVFDNDAIIGTIFIHSLCWFLFSQLLFLHYLLSHLYLTPFLIDFFF